MPEYSVRTNSRAAWAPPPVTELVGTLGQGKENTRLVRVVVDELPVDGPGFLMVPVVPFVVGEQLRDEITRLLGLAH